MAIVLLRTTVDKMLQPFTCRKQVCYALVDVLTGIVCGLVEMCPHF